MHSLNSWRATNRKLRAGSLLTLALSLGAGGSAMAAGTAPEKVAVPYNQEAAAAQLANARFLGHQNPQSPVDLVFMLPLRNKGVLDALLRRIYDPKDALYRQYLTPSEFAQQFGPTQDDYDAIIQYAQSIGLSVVSETPTRTLLHVRGTTDAVENALGVRFSRYLLADGRVSYAAQGLPSMPKDVAGRISGIVGLNNLTLHHHHLRSNPLTQSLRSISPHTGPTGGFAPSDVQAAYNVPTTVQGQGQSVALYELEGYKTSDITTFTTQFSLPAANLTNVPINGYNGTIQDIGNEPEVVLDIDMVLTMAPKIGNIYVYEAKLAQQDALDEWQKIADDKLASVVSTSWGQAEDTLAVGQATTENNIFTQMKAQGQTVYDASGDTGAFDDGTKLSVDDPAGQPLITGVGGTSLVVGAGSVYSSETVWNDLEGEGGGGISSIWPKPDYQLNFQGASGTPTTFREVPDVSLNADPETGYDIFVDDAGGWLREGGTSAAAPLWAGFTALVNQQLLSLPGGKQVGFINPTLYAIAASNTTYGKAFHDITVGNNDSGTTAASGYPALVGFDDASGLGTFNGGELFKQLAVVGGKSPGKLTGTVTDQNGQPINTTGSTPVGAVTVTATVTATNSVAATTTTKTDGTYSLNLLADVNYNLSFDTPGYAGPIIANVDIPSTGTSAGTLAVPNEEMTKSYTYAAGLQMISYPADFGTVADFSQVFGLADDPPVGIDPVLFVYSPSQNVYAKTPTFPADTLHTGVGYWVKLTSATSIHRIGLPPPNTNFYIPLQPGWNMIGDPFATEIKVSKLLVAPSNEPTRAVSFAASTLLGNGKLNNVMWTYPVGGGSWGTSVYNAVNTTGTYTSGTTTGKALTAIEPYAGYWIYANTNCTVIVPPN